jgi:tetratricopeptide (TPR) repeat protein
MVMAYHKLHSKVDTLAIEDLLLLKKDGKPDYGAILEYFRILAGWSREQLAFYYSEALGKEVITASWVYHMEKENRIPIDQKRRWILARLLNIPPILFGLQDFKNITALFDWEPVDIAEYRTQLAIYGKGWHSTSIFQEVDDIKRRIGNLYREAPYSSEKKEMLTLLCSYLIALGDIAHSYMRFTTAISHFDKAIKIAEQEELYDILAFALRQRGSVQMEHGEITTGLEDREAGQRHFEEAALTYQRAQRFDSKIQPIFRGLVLSCAGEAYAYIARDSEEFDAALKILDQATTYIGQQKQEELLTIGAILDEERYHMNKCTAYLSHGSKKANALAARKELKLASSHSINSLSRRAYTSTLLAKSYVLSRDYEKAVIQIEEALDVVLESRSTIHLMRLDILHQQLRKTPYGNSSDVAILSTKLLKAQQPELFN